MSKETWEELAPIVGKGRSLEEVLDNPVTAPEFLFYLHRLTHLAIEYFDDPAAFSVTTDLSPGFLYRTMPRFAPGNPEKFEDIYEDLKKKILPGLLLSPILCQSNCTVLADQNKLPCMLLAPTDNAHPGTLTNLTQCISSYTHTPG
ncbi:hypothetical protein OESDEN_12685 [Oesophagostomum dentatum]|uniref:Uncharacterized protein n=1 Tax=Oesophagostomum dentatum TaxID=61180 RepID=A0A0B1SRG8_OESDE|nr:hypothetical protein OESDEN_12685 [Oesophagostomum dentatum]